MVTSAGPTCLACSTKLPTYHLQLQLEQQIRHHVAKYYEGWTECDDPTCRNRTRMMSVYGRRCMKSHCRGTVKPEVKATAHRQKPSNVQIIVFGFEIV